LLNYLKFYYYYLQEERENGTKSQHIKNNL